MCHCSSTSLSNDSDAEGDPLTLAAIEVAPSNGTATINANNTITYTPNPNYHGDDSFVYRIDDGEGGSDTATVALTVNSVNDSPDAVDDLGPIQTDEDSPVAIDVLANDSDPEGDTLTVAQIHVSPANGVASINADGTITYSPAPDFDGSDTFVYNLSDGNGGSDLATVSVSVTPVNDPPIARDDPLTETPTTVTFSGISGTTLSPYYESGYRFDSPLDFLGPFALGMVGATASPSHVVVTRQDELPFDVTTIEVSEWNSAIGSQPLTFTGIRADGSTVVQNYATQSAFERETVELVGFTGLSEFRFSHRFTSWGQSGCEHVRESQLYYDASIAAFSVSRRGSAIQRYGP